MVPSDTPTRSIIWRAVLITPVCHVPNCRSGSGAACLAWRPGRLGWCRSASGRAMWRCAAGNSVALVAGMLLVGAAGVHAPRLHREATFCLMWQHSRVQEGDSECLRHSTMLLLLNIAPADHRRAAALPARNQLQERPEAGGSRAQGQEHGGAGVRWGVAGHAGHAVLAARWLGVLGMLSLRHRECMH